MRAPGFSAGSRSKIVFFSGPASEIAGEKRLAVFSGAGLFGYLAFHAGLHGRVLFPPPSFRKQQVDSDYDKHGRPEIDQGRNIVFDKAEPSHYFIGKQEQYG